MDHPPPDKAPAGLEEEPGYDESHRLNDLHLEWDKRTYEASLALNVGVVAAVWAIWGSVRAIQHNGWAVAALCIVGFGLLINLVMAFFLTELHRRRGDYAASNAEEWARLAQRFEAKTDPNDPFPFTVTIQRTKNGFRAIRVVLPVLGVAALVVAAWRDLKDRRPDPPPKPPQEARMEHVLDSLRTVAQANEHAKGYVMDLAAALLEKDDGNVTIAYPPDQAAMAEALQALGLAITQGNTARLDTVYIRVPDPAAAKERDRWKHLARGLVAERTAQDSALVALCRLTNDPDANVRARVQRTLRDLCGSALLRDR
ncbi:MAG: hypothetical protein JST66_06175, partial [Bacteroidetes bacterium]|nr:hypothetical protein [Bacteroidota bacterium]